MTRPARGAPSDRARACPQRAHELLLKEADLYGLAPLPLPYDPRENDLGVTFELLLYGRVGRYPPIARRFRQLLETTAARARAARAIAKFARGWIARREVASHRAAVKVQAASRGRATRRSKTAKF